MTTAELLSVIARDPSAVRTIGSVAHVAGVTRRNIEESIQSARLQGKPIITDGGIRLARDAKEKAALIGWLTARVQSQMDTIAALTSQARLDYTVERRERIAARWEARRQRGEGRARAVPRAAGATDQATLGLVTA